MGTRTDRGTLVLTDVTHLRQSERWIANVRVGAVGFAVLQVALSTGYPPGYATRAWTTTAVLAIGTAILFWLSRKDLPRNRQVLLAFTALAFDTVVISSYLLIYNFESGTPVRQVMYLAIVEAAVRFAILGPLVLTALTLPVLIEFERLRSAHAAESFHT